MSRYWGLIPIILIFKRLRKQDWQEHCHEFKANLEFPAILNYNDTYVDVYYCIK